MQMTYFQFDSFLVAFLDTVTKVSHTIWTRWGAQSTRTWQTFWWPRWKRRVVTMWRFQGLLSFLKKVDQRKRINQVKVLVFFLKPLIRRSSWRLGVEKEFSTSCPNKIQWTTHKQTQAEGWRVPLLYKEAGSFCSGLLCKGSEQKAQQWLHWEGQWAKCSLSCIEHGYV